MSHLTEHQLDQIVMFVIEDHGTRLTEGEVSEVLGSVLEDVSGMETMDDQELTEIINQLRNKYDDSVRQSQINP